MPSGSCLCGKIKVSYTGTPIANGLCHCWDCRKTSGSVFSANAVIKAEDFSFTGSPKFYSKKGDNDNGVDLYFCGDCGSQLWGCGTFGDAKVLRIGILDGEEIEEVKPGVECYSERRLTWLEPAKGTTDLIGMGNASALVEEEPKTAEA